MANETSEELQAIRRAALDTEYSDPGPEEKMMMSRIQAAETVEIERHKAYIRRKATYYGSN